MSQRCNWVKTEADAHYHDTEWGVPSHDDRHLFEMLILEGAQAGLSWSTILNKRAGYREAFADFDVDAVALHAETHRKAAGESGIVRNRAKVESAVTNARAVQRIREEHGSLAAFLWSFVGDTPVQNARQSYRDAPASTEQSGRAQQGAEGVRLQVRRFDHLLCADAGHRHGQRSRGRLPVPRNARRSAQACRTPAQGGLTTRGGGRRHEEGRRRGQLPVARRSQRPSAGYAARSPLTKAARHPSPLRRAMTPAQPKRMLRAAPHAGAALHPDADARHAQHRDDDAEHAHRGTPRDAGDPPRVQRNCACMNRSPGRTRARHSAATGLPVTASQ